MIRLAEILKQHFGAPCKALVCHGSHRGIDFHGFPRGVNYNRVIYMCSHGSHRGIDFVVFYVRVSDACSGSEL